MKSAKRVGLRDLKNHLSAYIKEVRKGTVLLVFDRDQMVAEISLPQEENSKDAKLLFTKWEKEGILIPRKNQKKAVYSLSSVSLEEGTAKALLDEDRGR